MGKYTERIDNASPTRLEEITEDLLSVECDFCHTEREDVKDARNSLRDYIAAIRSELAAFGLIGGATGLTAYASWAKIVEVLAAIGIVALAVIVGAFGLVALWWLYEVWKQITLRVRELRQALKDLDDCLEYNLCY